VSSQVISVCATEIHVSIVFWNCSESVMFFSNQKEQNNDYKGKLENFTIMA
jgi:hypothetical protein